jgi:hypothetical protein
MFKPYSLLAGVLGLLAAITITVVQTPSSTQAQDLSDYLFVPNLSELGCNEVDIGEKGCIFDASRPSQLFVYVVETAQLWRYPSNGGLPTHYDLSPYKTALGTTFVLDFVALSDTELLFIGAQFDNGRDELTIYNTETNQIREPVLDFGDIVLTGCDALLSNNPLDSLYAFPDASRALLCAIERGRRKLIIVDFAPEQIERVIDIPATAGNPALLPWRKVFVGWDGNIYVQTPSINSNEDVRDVFETINRPPLLDNVIRVLRFNAADAGWTLLQLPINLFSSDDSSGDLRPGSISEIAGVDAQGNIYYWDKAFFYNSPSVSLLTIFDATGQFVGQVPSQTLLDAGAENYMYLSMTGELVAYTELPSVIVSVDPAPFFTSPIAVPTIPFPTPIHSATAAPRP